MRGSCPTICRAAGFTLLELLAVIALIAVLASILMPAANRAQHAAARARTRVQFSQWAAALEAYRQEHGAYPDLGARLVNTEAASGAAGPHPFHDALAGVRRDGSPIPGLRGLRFLAFSETDLVRPADIAGGHNRPDELNLIRDGFHNTSIGVVVDANLDGLIDITDAPTGLPAVETQPGGLRLRPELPTEGIHAGVIFYSAPPGATAVEDLVVSWR